VTPQQGVPAAVKIVALECLHRARNPEADSSLPGLVFLPIEGGTRLKARESGRVPNLTAALEPHASPVEAR
jgi:hypothetical protein